MSAPDVSRFWRLGPLSYSRSTDMDCTVILMHHVRLELWRFRLEFSYQTRASIDRIKQADARGALRRKAVKAWGEPAHVEWALDDHWADGGTHESTMALMQRIVDGTEKNPWAEAEASP